jgi:hypothetical protein
LISPLGGIKVSVGTWNWVVLHTRLHSQVLHSSEWNGVCLHLISYIHNGKKKNMRVKSICIFARKCHYYWTCMHLGLLPAYLICEIFPVYLISEIFECMHLFFHQILEWLGTQHWWDISEMYFLMLVMAYRK